MENNEREKERETDRQKEIERDIYFTIISFFSLLPSLFVAKYQIYPMVKILRNKVAL